MKGKNFGNRKPENERPLNDFLSNTKVHDKGITKFSNVNF